MDITGWLDYFVTGLETQMIEVKERGEQVQQTQHAITYFQSYDKLRHGATTLL